MHMNILYCCQFQVCLPDNELEKARNAVDCLQYISDAADLFKLACWFHFISCVFTTEEKKEEAKKEESESEDEDMGFGLFDWFDTHTFNNLKWLFRRVSTFILIFMSPLVWQLKQTNNWC